MSGRGDPVGRRDFVVLLTSAAWPFIAQADEHEMHVVGLFRAGSTLPLDRRAIFTEALLNFGWIEGKNIAFEDRSGENQVERLSEVASELVRLKVDAIVAIGTLAAFAARRATSTIPIIMAPASDPADTGLVASLARPGGNVAGLSIMAPELAGKRLELLREVVPSASRVAVLWNADSPSATLVQGDPSRG
jgi:putative ABC transport system substrate-binding protein